jgi:hypothetical protein
VDERGAWCRRLRDLINAHVSDLGGQDMVSSAEMILVRHKRSPCCLGYGPRHLHRTHGSDSANKCLRHGVNVDLSPPTMTSVWWTREAWLDDLNEFGPSDKAAKREGTGLHLEVPRGATARPRLNKKSAVTLRPRAEV